MGFIERLTWERGRHARASGYSKMDKLFKTRSLMEFNFNLGAFFGPGVYVKFPSEPFAQPGYNA